MRGGNNPPHGHGERRQRTMIEIAMTQPFPSAFDYSIKTLDDLADATLKSVATMIGHPNWYHLYRHAANGCTRKKYHSTLIRELHRISLDALKGGTAQ